MKHSFEHGESKGTCTCVIRDYWNCKKTRNEIDKTWCECGHCQRCGREDRGWPGVLE